MICFVKTKSSFIDLNSFICFSFETGELILIIKKLTRFHDFDLLVKHKCLYLYIIAVTMASQLPKLYLIILAISRI